MGPARSKAAASSMLKPLGVWRAMPAYRRSSRTGEVIPWAWVACHASRRAGWFASFDIGTENAPSRDAGLVASPRPTTSCGGGAAAAQTSTTWCWSARSTTSSYTNTVGASPEMKTVPCSGSGLTERPFGRGRIHLICDPKHQCWRPRADTSQHLRGSRLSLRRSPRGSGPCPPPGPRKRAGWPPCPRGSTRRGSPSSWPRGCRSRPRHRRAAPPPP